MSYTLTKEEGKMIYKTRTFNTNITPDDLQAAPAWRRKLAKLIQDGVLSDDDEVNLIHQPGCPSLWGRNCTCDPTIFKVPGERQ